MATLYVSSVTVVRSCLRQCPAERLPAVHATQIIQLTAYSAAPACHNRIQTQLPSSFTNRRRSRYHPSHGTVDNPAVYAAHARTIPRQQPAKTPSTSVRATAPCRSPTRSLLVVARAKEKVREIPGRSFPLHPCTPRPDELGLVNALSDQKQAVGAVQEMRQMRQMRQGRRRDRQSAGVPAASRARTKA